MKQIKRTTKVSEDCIRIVNHKTGEVIPVGLNIAYKRFEELSAKDPNYTLLFPVCEDEQSR